MARPEFGPTDLDQPHQIVFGIAQPLRRGEPTEIDKGIIERVYRLTRESDDGDQHVDGPLDEKCAEIATKLRDDYEVDTEYEIGSVGIQFRLKPR